MFGLMIRGVCSKSLPKRRILRFGFAVHIFTTKKPRAVVCLVFCVVLGFVTFLS
jgi:hypothetical protein